MLFPLRNGALAILALALAWNQGAEGRVTRIVINATADPDPVLTDGAPFPIKRITGRAFGELDPKDPHNAIIQDIRSRRRTRRARSNTRRPSS